MGGVKKALLAPPPVRGLGRLDDVTGSGSVTAIGGLAGGRGLGGGGGFPEGQPGADGLGGTLGSADAGFGQLPPPDPGC